MIQELNPAAGLHSILQKMSQSGAASVQKGWESVLGVQYGTPDFARRHAEVVALVGRISDRLYAMPEGNPTRERNLRYLPHWYSAVVYSNGWNAQGHPAQNVISVDHLDDLGNFSDILVGRDRDAGDGISDDAMARLREGLAKWRELVDESTLPGQLREQIRGQVDHLEWLLTGVETFGPQPVVARTEELVGTGVTALALIPRLAKKVTEAVVYCTGALTIINGGMAEGNVFLEHLTTMSAQIEELTSGESRPQIEQKRPQAELPAVGDDNGQAGDVVDAEVVDEPHGP
ncbi:hypothetical protein [Nocardia sienata]|uniref:hypothetical protein n=1 Tax=Nocardia sienata TaxID=248552 RepID=UPI0012EE91D2|nr:hypothetical protein [Nocardia sienata]